MTEYRKANRDHANAFAEYHADIARRTTADRETAKRHRRLARRWKTAARLWALA